MSKMGKILLGFSLWGIALFLTWLVLAFLVWLFVRNSIPMEEEDD